MNTLYYGDNLNILREHIADESIDLIYLDPPFNSKPVYEARTMITDVNNSAEREKAQIGLFVTLTPPIEPMQKEAVSAGYYDSQFGAFPKIQILTVEDLLSGKEGPRYPDMARGGLNFKKARKETGKDQPKLFDA